MGESTLLDVRGTPYPPFVHSDVARRRWNFSLLIALATAAAYAPEGQVKPDPLWTLHAARVLYAEASLATGTPAEYADALQRARKLDLV